MNSEMNYLLAYNDFLLRESAMQEHMNNCIHEAVCIAEGTPVVLAENGITNFLKNAWNRFVTFINKIYGKAVEIISRIDSSSYLEKYADIITKQKWKAGTVSMYNWNSEMISKLHAEQFDPAKIDIMIQGPSAYLNNIASGVMGKYNGSDESKEINAFIEEQFKGGTEEVDINMDTLNMTDLYNFCHDIKKIQDEFKKDQTAVTSSVTKFENMWKNIDQAKAEEIKKAEADQAAQSSATPAEGEKSAGGVKRQPDTTGVSNAKVGSDGSGNTSNPEGAMLSLNKSFSSVVEANVNKTNTLGASGGGPNTNSNTKFSKNANGLSGQQATDSTVAGIKLSGKTYTEDDIKKASATYNTVNGAICSQKINAITAMYKDYMTIIRAHVSSYVGEKNMGGGVAAKGTDYSQGQPQKAQ